VFQAEQQSFHLKAYICTRSSAGETAWGAAFVGSSNLSWTALTDGLEWNLRAKRCKKGAKRGQAQ
jgi:HKD family nuclease